MFWNQFETEKENAGQNKRKSTTEPITFMHLCGEPLKMASLMCQTNIILENWNGRCLDCLLLNCYCGACCIISVVPRTHRISTAEMYALLVRRARHCVCVWVSEWMCLLVVSCGIEIKYWYNTYQLSNLRFYYVYIEICLLVQWLIVVAFQASTHQHPPWANTNFQTTTNTPISQHPH